MRHSKKIRDEAFSDEAFGYQAALTLPRAYHCDDCRKSYHPRATVQAG